MKYLIPAIRLKIFMTILLGLVYPFAVTGVSQIVFPRQADGDFIARGGQLVGAVMIGQGFTRPEYFWSRPSAINYNPLPSGGSNLGQDSQALKEAVAARVLSVKAAHPEKVGEPPQDLIFASASGLDPHISPAAAEYQTERVARARGVDAAEIKKLIMQASAGRSLGVFGEPTVNVLELNLLLDRAQNIEMVPNLAPPK